MSLPSRGKRRGQAREAQLADILPGISGPRHENDYINARVEPSRVNLDEKTAYVSESTILDNACQRRMPAELAGLQLNRCIFQAVGLTGYYIPPGAGHQEPHIQPPDIPSSVCYRCHFCNLAHSPYLYYHHSNCAKGTGTVRWRTNEISNSGYTSLLR